MRSSFGRDENRIFEEFQKGIEQISNDQTDKNRGYDCFDSIEYACIAILVHKKVNAKQGECNDNQRIDCNGGIFFIEPCIMVKSDEMMMLMTAFFFHILGNPFPK